MKRTRVQVLLTALRRNMLACPDLRRLDPLLARHRLTDAETGQVVLSALKVELSQVCGSGGLWLSVLCACIKLSKKMCGALEPAARWKCVDFWSLVENVKAGPVNRGFQVVSVKKKLARMCGS